MDWGNAAEWTAVGAIILLGVIAVFQDRIRQWLASPKLDIVISTERPDCIFVPFTNTQTGEFLRDSVHVRFRVTNGGRAQARNVEVYAEAVTRDTDGRWSPLQTFAPMNLTWADLNAMYFPGISPRMSKYCTLGYIVDPGKRKSELEPAGGVGPDETCFAFSLIARPNNKSHIVGPGRYRVRLIVAAENAAPVTREIELHVSGKWFPDEAAMLHDGITVSTVRS
jgi:hypothetical protein